jgi:adenosine deaminase
MAPISRDILRRLPKAELHCHLDGSVRPQTLIDLGRELGKPMPAPDAESLRSYMKVTDARNLEDYLARFETTLSVMQTSSALERIAYELAEDASKDGVRYLEVRYAPILNVREGLALEEAVEAPLRGLARAHSEHGIVGKVLVTAIRNMPASDSQMLSELAVSFKERGVVGFDLAGGEAGFPASAHAAAFSHALKNDLACTCHAGEGDGSESVRQAVHVCGAHRIGHATRLIEDSMLTDYCNDHRIPLEICLTSNVQTRVADSYANHPFREYFDRGLQVVLNTDNRLMSGVTLTDEYVHASHDIGFTFDELARVALNGFESAFVHLDERKRLIAVAERTIAELRKEVA